MSIQSVAILGTGAVGSYLVWGLSEKPNIELCVVASGERKERYEKEGFWINDQQYRPVIKTPEQAYGVDLLIVSMKYYSLRPSLDDIRAIVGPNTIVMSLMNGVESEEIIAEVIPAEQIIYSLIKIASERVGNHVKFIPEDTIGILYGEIDPNHSRERVDALGELFEGTKIWYRETNVILPEIWNKFLMNVSLNLPQAIVGCGLGAYRDSVHVKFIRNKLREEVTALATAKGIDIDLCDKTVKKGSKVVPRARYSTLQDLDAHRQTEIDMFAGAVVKMGQELGIPTPYSEMTLHLIHALEEKNEGKFDYE